MRPAAAGLFVAVVLLWLGAALPAVAQVGAPPVDPRTSGPTQAAAPGPTLDNGSPDYATWTTVAERAELTLETRRGSTFALQRLRAELVIWREVFLDEMGLHGPRIATVQTQMTALGLPPADGLSEAPEVAARRAELDGQLARARAPAVLASEAYARANGMIGEIDALLRARQAMQLLTRGPSPLNPAIWVDAWEAITVRAIGLWKEVSTSVRSRVRLQTLQQTWPNVLFYLAIAGLLLTRARHWNRWAETEVLARVPSGQGVPQFVFSLTAVLLPYVGLWMVAQALQISGMFGFRATQLIQAVPLAGLNALLGHWLASQFMAPDQPVPPPFDFSEQQKSRGRRLIVQAGWVMAISVLWGAFLAAGDIAAPTRALLDLPLNLVLALLLFRIGRLLTCSQSPGEGEETDGLTFRRGVSRVVGRVTMLTALLSPILAMIGYAAAADAILGPMVSTLFVLAVVVRLQWLGHDLYTLVMRSEEASRDALIPVLVGIVLLLVALPVMAVIWGARVEDMVEIWARFREGFQFGETRIAPADFLTFVVVFTIGYAVTRLVQSTLRTTVLPRTSLDPGGKTAIVAGIGYIGIFVAALAAVSSAGLDLTSLAIVAGALSVGIGFGLQNIVSNFVSGIILLIERPVGEGDWIEVGGKMGYVRNISVRSTRIETFDRTDVIVPNSDLVSGQVINWTRGSMVGRIIVPVGVAYGTDTDKVTAILREIAEANPLVVLTPPPAVLFMGFGADALQFEIRAVLRDVNFSVAVRSEMNHAIARAFAQHGIEIPFAQRDIWLRNADVLRGDRPQAGDDDAARADQATPNRAQADRPAVADEPDLDPVNSDGGAADGDPDEA
ncbi:MAG: mechanosensitive ion channel family protein [Rubellimicrobium sp.]|nr:mechanosensitive ion channel family protein [Rubellimicrobium sp.]